MPVECKRTCSRTYVYPHRNGKWIEKLYRQWNANYRRIFNEPRQILRWNDRKRKENQKEKQMQFDRDDKCPFCYRYTTSRAFVFRTKIVDRIKLLIIRIYIIDSRWASIRYLMQLQDVISEIFDGPFYFHDMDSLFIISVFLKLPRGGFNRLGGVKYCS